MKDIRSQNRKTGLYIHVPFCRHICFYCDFVHSLYNKENAGRYLDELEKELSEISGRRFATVYIGGGTPTALSGDQLERLLLLATSFGKPEEFSVEINPESFDEEKARLFSRYGVNRVSIGVQSFDEDRLTEMNRHHTVQDVERCLRLLDEAGIINRTIDIIYGFRNQTVEDVLDDLKKAVKLDITHISIYELEIHENTVFGKRNYPAPDDEISAAMYEAVIEFLTEHGYHHYEVSNFALPGYESRHNQIYWHYDDWYGAGPGAAGKVGSVRWTNTSSMQEYLNGNHVEEREQLSHDDVVFEAVMMGLRLLEGIDIQEFNERFDTDLEETFEKAIGNGIKKGLLEISTGHLKVTHEGLFYLNDVLVDFMQEL